MPFFSIQQLWDFIWLILGLVSSKQWGARILIPGNDMIHVYGWMKKPLYRVIGHGSISKIILVVSKVCCSYCTGIRVLYTALAKCSMQLYILSHGRIQVVIIAFNERQED